MELKIAVIAVAAALAVSSAQADEKHHKGAQTGEKHQQSAQVDGEVRKVDKEAKKITIKHGPMPSFDMPAMTMVFQVKDPALMDMVKAGDKVKLEAQKLGGAFTVTSIVPEK